MKIETRIFKTKSFLLLLPETEDENKLLDRLGNLALATPQKIEAVVTTDDSFMPYIRILIP